MLLFSHLRTGVSAGKSAVFCFHWTWKRFLHVGTRVTMSPVRVQVEPDSKCLFDRPVTVKVEGLSPHQPVALRATLTGDKGDVFASVARYQADERGLIDLSQSASLGGDYTGVQPMGFLWALKPLKPLRRLMKRDMATPFTVHITVHGQAAGSVESTTPPLASCLHERSFLGEGVKRIPVREGRIRGTVFLPRGDGPFPGVIDLGGTAGGLLEHRGCLLANHGFVTMVLAYFGFEDLPQNMDEFHLEYFEEALHFFQALPQVRENSIGVLGLSKGADLALSMASFLSGISAVVNVSGCYANFQCQLHYKGTTLPALKCYPEKIKVDQASGLLNFSEAYDDPRDPGCQAVVPIERASARFLFVAGEDDKVWNASLYASEAAKRLISHGKERPEVLIFPGTGHIIEPPYFPHCHSSFHKVINAPVLWGGQAESHAFAQEEAWRRIRQFFLDNLGAAGCRQSKL
ncbi:acyl-coenzyme A thioesterase 1-like isoform X2 [Lepisosteus oculatus]|uniref:acyl-coenzyme A thioesterase 1-like isoform X2 n=1 Tax=Lepisosteus oculatus TaxID=7918 RepID=UPI003716AFA2